MADAIIDFFRELLNNDILTIFIVSMLPVVELRGAIPIAMQMGIPWYASFGYSFLGSIAVAPVLLLILLPLLNAMKKIKGFRGLANGMERLFQSKAENVKIKAGNANTKQKEDLIKMLGVFLFVAVPLPLTGVWTGSAVAVFLGLGFWKSLVSVAVGNISAGLIMAGLSVLFKEHINTFLTVFFVVVLVVLVANIIYMIVKNKLKKKKESIDKSQFDKNVTIADEGNVKTEESDMLANQKDILTNDSDFTKDKSKRSDIKEKERVDFDKVVDYSNISANEIKNDKENDNK